MTFEGAAPLPCSRNSVIGTLGEAGEEMAAMSQRTPGWYSDPTRRFAARYMDAAGWTEHVRTAEGVPASDPPGPGLAASDAQADGPDVGPGPNLGHQRRVDSPWGYVLNPGGLIASFGAVLVLVSVIGGMDFIILNNIAGDSDRLSLSAVAATTSSTFTIEDDDFGVTGSYAAFGGYAGALLAIPLAVVTGLRRRVGSTPPGVLRAEPGWPQAIAGLMAGFLLLWLFMATQNNLPLLDIQPATGAYLGMLGYGAIVIGAFPWRPLDAA